jgi:hypothetical protein
MEGVFAAGDVPDTYADVDDLVEQFGRLSYHESNFIVTN